MLSHLLRSLRDTVAPTRCHACGGRTAGPGEPVCADCCRLMPRTGFSRTPYDNDMARLMWLRVPTERCAALTWHNPRAAHSAPVYDLKYHNCPGIGLWMGHMMGAEMGADGFFDGIDAIVAVPLTAGRQRERGYNQSVMIARGLAGATGIGLADGVLRRTAFGKSQTQLSAAERHLNVEHAFALADGTAVAGRHVLLVDDILTTGATAVACARLLAACRGTRVSVATWGMTRT